MYLKTDRIVASIKDVTFRSYRTGVGSEYILDPTALTGWDDGVNTRRDATVRPVSSGDFKEPYTRASRVIGISGTAMATNRLELQSMRDALTGVLSDGEYAEIAVETSVSTRYANVGLENSVSWVQQHDTVAVFRVEFYSAEPYIYGLERTIHLNSTVSAGGGLKYPISYALNYNAVNAESPNVYVANRGNITAWPKFVVTGDYYSGFTITNGSDKMITFIGPVSYESPVTIDTATGTATQNGIDKSIQLTHRQWFGIEPNETLQPKFTPIQNASGWCAIMIRDTFV